MRRAWPIAILLIVLLGCRLFTPGQTPVNSTATPTATRPANPTLTPLPLNGFTASPNCFPSNDLQPDRDGLGDPYFPSLGNGGYDVQHYALDMEVTPDNGILNGRVEITALALEPLEVFSLDFTGLTIKELSVDGARAEHRRRGAELMVTPQRAVRADAQFTVVVTYQGIPTAVDAGVGFELGWSRYDGGSYVASEPAGASTWFPVNDHPCDKATYAFRVTVPKPYVAVANGILRETVDNGATRTYVWEMNDLMASYLATVNIDEFVEDAQTGPNGLPIRNYYVRDVVEDARVDFALTAEMIAFYSETFGPYPFEAYGVVVVGAPLGFALETQTISLFGRDAVDGQGGASEVAAHELAHQWFGDSVSLETWQDIWLNEGFATYAQWMWLEHEQGRAELDRQVREWYQRMQDMGTNPPGDPGTDDLFGLSVYFRGAMTLHALRVKVGDETFSRILRTYYEQYRDGNAGTEEFIALARYLGGADLGSFFRTWLYDQQMPAIPEMNLSP